MHRKGWVTCCSIARLSSQYLNQTNVRHNTSITILCHISCFLSVSFYFASIFFVFLPINLNTFVYLVSFILFSLFMCSLYNNQINARALIGQSAVGYCAGKPTEKIARLLNYYIKAIDHRFVWFVGC